MHRRSVPLLAFLSVLLAPGLLADEVFFVEEAKLAPDDLTVDDQFGHSVALSAERAVVGAPRVLSGPGNLGAAYVYVREGGAWALEQKLFSPDAIGSSEFGTAVAIDGDRVLVGALGDDSAGLTNAGSAFVFVRGEAGWSFEAKLVDSDAGAGDAFGGAVALSGTRRWSAPAGTTTWAAWGPPASSCATARAGARRPSSTPPTPAAATSSEPRCAWRATWR